MQHLTSHLTLALTLAGSVGFAGHAHGNIQEWTDRSTGSALLYEVAMADDGFGVIAGVGSTILRYDGSAWSTFPGDPWTEAGIGNALLYAAEATGSDNVWVGSYNNGRGYGHHDGNAWSGVIPAISSDRVSELWALTPDLMLSGHNGGNINLYDGSSWSRVHSFASGGAVLALGGTESGNIWAANTLGEVARSSDGGQTFTSVAVPTTLQGTHWNGLAVASESAVWFVGEGGKMGFWNGTELVEQEPDWLVDLKDVYAFADDNVYAVGENGNARYFDGTSWSTVDFGFAVGDHLFGVDGTEAGDLWIVGNNGRIIQGVVPEPASGALLLLSAGLLMARRRH